MTKSTRPKRRSPQPPSEWAKIIADWQNSGLSAAQYAKHHGLGATSLWRWSGKLRQRERLGGPRTGNASPATGFVPVQVVPGARGHDARRYQRHPGSIELELANGCVVRLRGDVSSETLRAALCAIRDVVSC